MLKTTLLGILLLIIIVTAASGCHLRPEAPAIHPPQLYQAQAERIIDGDTLLLTNGERVRLIGVDAPEMDTPEGQEAAEFVRGLISPDQNIWLEAVGNDRDRFNRLRRYVWIEIPTDLQDTHQRRMLTVNGLLLEYGHGVVWP
jgi:micrococcal nuclease